MEYTILAIFTMVFLFALLIGSILFYFIPTLIAWYCRSRNAVWIFLMNLLLGATMVGWAAAFLWAIYDAGAFDGYKK